MIAPLLTDSQFNSVMLVVVAVVGIVPGVLAAYWAKGSKQNSKDAKDAAEEAAGQVRTNGGMSDPNPNVNDHIKYQTEMLESVVHELLNQKKILSDHIQHSNIMDQAIAEVYLHVKPGTLLHEIKKSPE